MHKRSKTDRRQFLVAATGLSGLAWVGCGGASQSGDQADERQTLAQSFRVGFAPLAGMRSVESDFWNACDECARLGFHYIETDNTRLQIVEAYADRPDAFKEQMNQRGLAMVGFAQFSSLGDPQRRQETLDVNLRIGRFLQAVGGKYINHLFVPRPNPGVERARIFEVMTQDELDHVAELGNELGRRLFEEHGIRFAYHAEGVEVRAGLHHRVLEMTNPEYLDFWPDTGHLAAGGEDPLQVFQKYRSRMRGTHFKDYDPDIEWERDGEKRRGRFVELGRGIVDFQPLVDFLRESSFEGFVMGELDGKPESTPEMRDYLVDRLGLRLAPA